MKRIAAINIAVDFIIFITIGLQNQTIVIKESTNTIKEIVNSTFNINDNCFSVILTKIYAK